MKSNFFRIFSPWIASIALFCSALYGDRLILKKLLAQAFAKIKNGTQQSYGFGWFISEVQGAPSV